MRPSRSVRSPLADKHFKNVKKASEHAKGPHCMRLTACLPNRTRAPSGERARTGTLDEPDREGNMAHTRAADDFQTIRARMEELRREREGAAVTETDCGPVEPARRKDNAILVSLARLLNAAGHSLAVPDGS